MSEKSQVLDTKEEITLALISERFSLWLERMVELSFRDAVSMPQLLGYGIKQFQKPDMFRVRLIRTWFKLAPTPEIFF